MNQLFGLQHRGDRYLGVTVGVTQVPVSTASVLSYICLTLQI